MVTHRADYEPIPDVENPAFSDTDSPRGDGGGADYSGFSDAQGQLLTTLDEAIASRAALRVALLPTTLTVVYPNEIVVVTHGKTFAASLVAPNVTAAITALAALIVAATASLLSARCSGSTSNLSLLASEVLVQGFPYVNAVLVFAASVLFVPCKSVSCLPCSPSL